MSAEREHNMRLEDALKKVVEPGLLLLPDKMNTVEAKAMLLAIGLQESRFEHRKQIWGPDHGFYQFEKNGGVKGVVKHPAPNPFLATLDDTLGISEIYNQIINDDEMSTVFARLLLYTDPAPLPKLTCDPSESWKYYLRNWRPGKPHRETWDTFWGQAVRAVGGSEKV